MVSCLMHLFLMVDRIGMADGWFNMNFYNPTVELSDTKDVPYELREN